MEIDVEEEEEEKKYIGKEDENISDSIINYDKSF